MVQIIKRFGGAKELMTDDFIGKWLHRPSYVFGRQLFDWLVLTKHFNPRDNWTCLSFRRLMFIVRATPMPQFASRVQASESCCCSNMSSPCPVWARDTPDPNQFFHLDGQYGRNTNESRWVDDVGGTIYPRYLSIYS